MDELSNLKWDENIKVMKINKELHDFINLGKTHERVYLQGTKSGERVFSYADRVGYCRLLIGLSFLACLFVPMMFLVFVLFMFKQREEIKHGLPKEYLDGLKEFKEIVLNKRIIHIYGNISNVDELELLNAIADKTNTSSQLTKDFIKKYSKDDEDA